jgi:hypothetical protein
VEKPKKWVQPYRSDGSLDVIDKECIAKAEQRVYRVTWGTAYPDFEAEILL